MYVVLCVLARRLPVQRQLLATCSKNNRMARHIFSSHPRNAKLAANNATTYSTVPVTCPRFCSTEMVKQFLISFAKPENGNDLIISNGLDNFDEWRPFFSDDSSFSTPEKERLENQADDSMSTGSTSLESDISSENNQSLDKLHHQEETPQESPELELFGYEISNISSTHQYILITTVLFSFTLLYSYLQELISVHILNRRYSLFFGAVQFGCYAAWSYFLKVMHSLPDQDDEVEVGGSNITSMDIRAEEKHFSYYVNYSTSSSPLRQRLSNYVQPIEVDFKTFQRQQTATTSCPALRNTSSASKPPFLCYVGLSLLRAIDVGLSNSSMMYLNYPAKTLLKSSRVIFTMIMGVVIQRKRFALLDYFAVSLLVIGLITFLQADASVEDAHFHPLGVLFLVRRVEKGNF